MPTRRTLKVNRNSYKYLLKKTLKHSNYLNSFQTLRKQNDDFDGQVPESNDFMVGTETFDISKPYPIVEPYSTESGVDLCAKLLEEKARYKEQLQLMVHYYKSDQKWLTKTYVEKTKYTKLPKYMIDLSVGNVSDPDELFDGNYNWYYSGGILSHFNMRGDDFLILPLPNNDFRITNTSNKNVTKITTDQGKHLDTTPIYSTKMYTKTTDTTLLARQRNKITVFDVLHDEDFTLLCTYTKTKMETSFLDAKFRNGELSYLDVKKRLSTRNLDVDVKTVYNLKESEKELPDSFLQFDYIDDKNFCIIDRKNLRLFDSRSQEETVHCMEDDYFLCDDLSAITKVEDSPYLYLCSLHNLKKFDTRTNKIVKSWAHMLNSSPSMIEFRNSFYDNVIFISSQKYDERVMLCSNAEESNIVQMVPNNFETMRMCNVAYEFDLFTELYEGRVKYSTAGIAVLPDRNGVSLYTCNTVGDIFQNDISKSKMTNDKSIEEFSKWRSNFKLKIKPVLGSHVRNESHLKHLLYEPIKQDNLKIYRAPNKRLAAFIADNTLENVNMAKIWCGEKKEESEGDDDMPPAISARSKVAEWLQRTKADSEVDYDDTENMSYSRFTQD